MTIHAPQGTTLSVPAGTIEQMETLRHYEHVPSGVWADLLLGLYPSLDVDQAADLWHRQTTRGDQDPTWGPDEAAAFQQWCLDRSARWTSHAPALLAMAATPPVDAREARALVEVEKTGDRALSTLAAQASMIAGLQQVDVDVAAERLDALRTQYATHLAHLPAPERPDPPAHWVHGFTCCDYVSRKSPCDPATLYAIYRAQCDPHVFDDAERHDNAEYAVVDLETASPRGSAWFQPDNGHIIEVGIVVTDADGSAHAEYEQLLRPDQAFLDEHGTGAIDIHGIAVSALDGAPTWDETAPDVLSVLDGRTLVAQNMRYEGAWLDHHFAEAGLEWQPGDVPVIDTLRLAQQHLSDIDNHRLGTVCATLGVPYTGGHRALHDAQVTVAVLVALRERAQARYAADARFTGLPVPA